MRVRREGGRWAGVDLRHARWDLVTERIGSNGGPVSPILVLTWVQEERTNEKRTVAF